MRSPLALALLTSATVALSATSPAPASAALVVNPGPILLAPWIEITGFQRTAADPAHPTWLRYAVTVTNTGKVAESGVLHYQNTATEAAGTVSFQVAAGASVDLDFADPEQSLVCVGRTFDLWLDGTGMDPTWRLGALDTACSFSDAISDSLALLTPDMRNYYRQNHVSLANAKASDAACNGVTIDVDVVNAAAKALTTLAVTWGASDSATSGVNDAGAVYLPLVPANGTVHTKVHVTEWPEKATLQVVDTAKAAPIAPQSITLWQQASCTAFTQLQ